MGGKWLSGGGGGAAVVSLLSSISAQKLLAVPKAPEERHVAPAGIASVSESIVTSAHSNLLTEYKLMSGL